MIARAPLAWMALTASVFSTSFRPLTALSM
jgi:hypothetical protein